MRNPRHLLTTLVLLAACGGNPSGPDLLEPEFSAINGAAMPAVRPGEVVTLEGRGFGGTQGDNVVRVTTDAGLTSAEVLRWRDGDIRVQLPMSVVSGPAFVELGGEQLGPVDLFIRRAAPYDPANRPWAEAARLPRRLWAVAAAALRFPSGNTVSSVVVATGGALPDSTLSDSTYLGSVDANGVITGWSAAPDTIVPAPRYLHAMAGADRTNARLTVEAVAYMIGGVDTAGRPLPDVLGIGVAADGSYGLWSPVTPLPRGRAGAAAVVALGNLFVIGGMGSDSLASPAVLTAVVNGPGTLNGWFEGPRLPEGRAFAAVAVQGTWLYVVGGQTGLVNPDSTDPLSADLRATVFRIKLSPRTGFFADSVWTEVPATLVAPRARHAALVVDSSLVVTGGVHAGLGGADETETAAILADGSLAAFAPSGQAPLADLAGGTLHGFAAPLVWDAAGAARVTIIGGRRPDGEISHSVWWH